MFGNVSKISISPRTPAHFPVWYPSGLFRRDPMRKLAFASIFLLGIAALGQSSRHAFTFDDAASLHSAAAVAVSPDGKTVLYQVRFGGHKGPTNTEWKL